VDVNDDAELLSQFVKNGSEDAFNQLLTQYLDLVYSTALRGVGGDAHLAEDVTQTVLSWEVEHTVPPPCAAPP
jgi:hypothetical protein